MSSDRGLDVVADPRGRLVALGRWLFGDRSGLVLWLGLVCWLGLTWRVSIFIQDTYGVANTLVALADGHLYITDLRYSLTFGSQPGLHLYDGQLYGRNYGQLAPAVPLVWALTAASTVVAPRLLLVGLWAGLGLALVTQVAEFERFDRERTRTVGSLVVVALFVASVLTATELPRDRLALAALQLSTILAAATAGLVLYRLLALFHGRRVGLVAGAGLGLATPMAFWATLPKRHTLVATLVLAAVYAFAVSRHREGDAALRARAGAYALAGYITWIHAFEALFVVAVLGVVDLLTARGTGLRELAVVGIVLFAASTPMLATNYAITGNPAQPPRLLSGVDTEFSPTPAPAGGGAGSGDGNASSGAAGGGDSGANATGGDTGGTGTGPGDTSGGTGGTSRPPPSLLDTAVDAAGAVSSVVGGAAGTVSAFAGQSLVDGVGVLGQPERLWHTFVRSGTIPSVNYATNDSEPIDLALLEAMPILAALAALPVLTARRGRALLGARRSAVLDPRDWSPARQTDFLVVALAVVLTVVYLPRLPLFSTLTVRYFHPVVPLAAYGICRLPAVRAGLADSRWLTVAYLASVGLALVVLLGGVSALDLAVGEAVQYNALWNLAAATVCAAAVVARTVTDRVPDRGVALALALPAGFTTGYLLLAALVYFRYGSYAFNLVALAAESLPAL